MHSMRCLVDAFLVDTFLVDIEEQAALSLRGVGEQEELILPLLPTKSSTTYEDKQR